MTHSTDIDTPLYLAGATKLEPLSCNWYAWSHMISPVQQALNLAFRYLPMMQSFIADAAIHEAAAKNPKMLGGSFMELTRQELPAVQALLQQTGERYRHLLSFAEDLLHLDRKLQRESGGCLDHVYQDLSPHLEGLIEVCYDLNNHPSVRALEELAYRGALDPRATQALSLVKLHDSERNFFLNTPRLANDARMILPLDFAQPGIDVLARSRIEPVALAELAAALQVAPQQQQRLLQYFTDAAPQRRQPEHRGSDVRVRYFGHACVLLQTDAVSVLIDPFVTWDDGAAADHLCFSDLPDRIDYVFLTHNHQDHFSPELLLQLRPRIGRILVPRNNTNGLVDPSMRLALRALGFNNVDVLDWMDNVPIPDGCITSVPFFGEHADLNIASKHGMHLRLKERTFLFLADSDCKDRALYRRVAAQLGKTDTLFIGMECDGAPLSWMYGCYLSTPISRKDDRSRRLSGSDAQRAAAITAEFGCGTAYVYAMGQEPWMRFVTGLSYTPDSKQIIESDKFIAGCRASGLTAERLYGPRTMFF